MKLLHAFLLGTLFHLAHTQEATELSRRKGGGGGHGGHSGGRSSGSRSSSGGSHSSSSGKSSPISFSGTGKILPVPIFMIFTCIDVGKSASTTSNGGGTPIVIPNGQAFSGRSFGGGDRQGVYGTRYDFFSSTQLYLTHQYQYSQNLWQWVSADVCWI